ncbi:MAG: metallophosphoesterase [Chlamydiales bacterium]|jgi:DNA repair exonuclease SbcCD nuclease subunit|nr:metallophosphoesterase [Chlamydiales bacterium]
MLKVFHSGDVHLGKERLQGKLPDQDMADAFAFVVERAIEEEADVFLITGDFFDTPTIEPKHLKQATELLTRLKQHSIPVLAIEGNHDRAFLQPFQESWLYYLSEIGLICLLSTSFNPLQVTPWDGRSGSFIDIQGVRFLGCGYQGSQTAKRIQQMLPILQKWRPMPVVLLLHAGLSSFFGESGGIPSEEMRALKNCVSYLALGHLHRPLLLGNWACNPGSLENCRLSEDAFPNRGYARIEIGDSVKVTLQNTPKRDLLRLEIDCTPFGSQLKGAVEKLEEAILSALKHVALKAESILFVDLTGSCHADRLRFDTAALEDKIQEACQAYAVFLNLEKLKLYTGRRKDLPQFLSKSEIEQDVLTHLVQEHFALSGEKVQQTLNWLSAIEKTRSSVKEARPLDAWLDPFIQSDWLL